jgi:hypothetical protein
MSTACLHEVHGECRKQCKFCEAKCYCFCHEGGDANCQDATVNTMAAKTAIESGSAISTSNPAPSAPKGGAETKYEREGRDIWESSSGGRRLAGWAYTEAYAERIVAAMNAQRELSEQLECDRSLVADCLTSANQEIDSRHWLTEGRGSYEWDDDRWHSEFLTAAVAIKAALAPLDKVAADWKGCPVDALHIRQARADLKAELAALRDANAKLVEALETAGDPVRNSVTELKSAVSTIDAALTAAKEHS